MWWRPEPSSVSPIYMPGRLRTASRPLRTLIDSESYSDARGGVWRAASAMENFRISCGKGRASRVWVDTKKGRRTAQSARPEVTVFYEISRGGEGEKRPRKRPHRGPVRSRILALLRDPYLRRFSSPDGLRAVAGLLRRHRDGRAPRTTRADAAAQGEGKAQTSESRALSNPDHDVAHRLAGLDRFMRGHDGAEIEALRHVVDELAALEHARDVGGCAGALLLRHQVHQEKLQRDAVLQQELE